MLIQLLYICNVFISISLLKENRMKRNRIIELQFFFQNFKAFDLQNSFFFYLQNSCLPYVLCFSPVLLRSDIRSDQISRSVVSDSLRHYPVYLTHMQSTSCEMPGWLNHSWNQDCREKHQQPQIFRWHHPYGRKWRRTKEPLDESERGEWKSWLKAQHSKN